MGKNDKTIVLGSKHIIFVAVIIGLIVGFVLLGGYSSEDRKVTGNVVQQYEEGQQVVKVSMKGNRYIFKPDTVKENMPVRMEIDMKSVFGCYRSIVIPALGVSKFVSEKDNLIEFIPTTTGRMKVSCSMGMGSGSFTVE